ncbi:MAG: hypothetical protein IT305_24060 [Chloroflexi bacterium]|nr:hypothetical protein [Chloroflexota bacterium]
MVLDRLLRAALRHLRLLAVPPLVVPLLVVPIALMLRPVYYESWVRLWVDTPAYLRTGDQVPRYVTSAQFQASRLSELLGSDSFIQDVARRTALAPLADTPRGVESLRSNIARSFATVPSGDHLLGMRFRGDTADLSFEMLTAILEVFRDRLITDRVNQAGIATSFYEGRVKSAEEQLTRSNEAVRRYVAANPRATSAASIDPARRLLGAPELPTAAVDPQLAELLRRQDLDKADVERARLALDQASLAGSAALAGQELGFQIVDPPRKPTEPTIERRRILMLPLIGLVIGILLSSALVTIFAVLDRTVYDPNGLGPNLLVLAMIPRLDRHAAAAPVVASTSIGQAAQAAE